MFYTYPVWNIYQLPILLWEVNFQTLYIYIDADGTVLTEYHFDNIPYDPASRTYLHKIPRLKLSYGVKFMELFDLLHMYWSLFSYAYACHKLLIS